MESYKSAQEFFQRSYENLNELGSFFNNYKHAKDSMAVLFNDIADELDPNDNGASLSTTLSVFSNVLMSIGSQNLYTAK